MFKFIKKSLYYFFPITSFILIPAIQGTTIAYCITAFLFLFIFFIVKIPEKIQVFYQVIFVFICILFLQILFAQFGDFVFTIPNITQLPLVDITLRPTLLFRSTIFTQSLYFIFSIIFFAFIIVFFEKKDFSSIFIGVRILLALGFIEWFYFLVTGNNFNFLSNRTFDHGNASASLFQTMVIGGYNIMRIKSLTGEPSMFAFTILPFWIIAREYNRVFDFFLLSIALILSFSTTALIGIFVYLIIILFRSSFKTKMIILFSIFIMLFFLVFYFSTFINDLWISLVIDKFSAISVSGMDRSGNLLVCFNYWRELNFWNKLFGIGFGVVRSTDFFSTILVNTGLFGLSFWIILFFLPYLFGKIDADLKKIFPALVVIFITLIISVPEYMYLSIWIVLGIAYKFKFEKYLKPKVFKTVE